MRIMSRGVFTKVTAAPEIAPAAAVYRKVNSVSLFYRSLNNLIALQAY